MKRIIVKSTEMGSYIKNTFFFSIIQKNILFGLKFAAIFKYNII